MIRSEVAHVMEAFNSDEPQLSPYVQSVNEGDIVNLFCLSGESSPPAVITWQVCLGISSLLNRLAGWIRRSDSLSKSTLVDGNLHFNFPIRFL